jgi:formylglycine-generating enzyme required for sulfatase activity
MVRGVVLGLLLGVTVCRATAAGIIDWATVGNAGNAADTAGVPNPAGAVGYEFRIGRYEVTIGQYAEFLSAVATNDPYGLYTAAMGTNANVAGIVQSGSAGNYTYSVVGSPLRPITYVSWFDAARFANWLQNGQGTGGTETGAYTLNGAISGAPPARNAGAQFYIPTEDEWYKAAYYKGGGTNAGYWTYATQSNTAPGNTIGGNANEANYYAGKYAVTQSASFSADQNYLTDVGAFSGSSSAYGTFDQNGNVLEWNDLTGAGGALRGVRGGDWDDTADALESSSRFLNDPTDELPGLGFRLASPVAVPEPGTGCLLAMAGIALGWRRWRLFARGT